LCKWLPPLSRTVRTLPESRQIAAGSAPEAQHHRTHDQIPAIH
jgi:hypothetical protein